MRTRAAAGERPGGATPAGSAPRAAALIALQQGAGNRAVGRMAAGDAGQRRRLQRFVIGGPRDYVRMGTEPEFEAQEVSGATRTRANAVPPPPGVDPPLRISDDGNMAVEHSDLSRRQPKVFYATRDVVQDANRRLRAVGSDKLLHRERTAVLAVVVPGTGSTRVLDRVVPHLTTAGYTGNNKASGLGMEVEESCAAVAETIVHYGGTMGQPHLNVALPDVHSYSEYSTVKYMVEWVRTEGRRRANRSSLKFWRTYADADAKAKKAFAKGTTMAELDTVAQAYKDLLVNDPALADEVARQLGVNQYAQPQVGEAYETARLVNGGPSWNPATAVRSFWASHIGAVVARSGDDAITLENYQRGHESAPGATQTDAPAYYFQMYGHARNPGQSWHEQWTTGAVTAHLPPVGDPLAPTSDTLTLVRHRRS